MALPVEKLGTTYEERTAVLDPDPARDGEAQTPMRARGEGIPSAAIIASPKEIPTG